MGNLVFVQKDIPVGIEHQIKKLISFDISNLYIESQYSFDSPEFNRLLEEAKPLDCLILYSLSAIWHFRDLPDYFLRLKEKEIRLVTIEENIDTDIMPEFYENSLLVFKLNTMVKAERIKHSIADRVNKENAIGRPTINDEIKAKIRFLHKQKMSVREIALYCDVSVGTAHKYANTKE